MRSSHSLDRIAVTFDEDRLIDQAGLLLPATVAQHLGLGELVDAHVDLGAAPGRANAGDKLLSLVASALAGGDCIDDAAALRGGGGGAVLGHTVKAPSTLGTFLRSFRWGHVRQLDRVSRALLARAWTTAAGPGEGPLTIDIDSTICVRHEVARLREGSQKGGPTHVMTSAALPQASAQGLSPPGRASLVTAGCEAPGRSSRVPVPSGDHKQGEDRTGERK